MVHSELIYIKNFVTDLLQTKLKLIKCLKRVGERKEGKAVWVQNITKI